jgi:hypothetical protein
MAAGETQGRRNPSGPCRQLFDPEKIGRARYHSNRVSVSRAFSRLAERGLVFWVEGAVASWVAVKITDQGREALMVDSAPN